MTRAALIVGVLIAFTAGLARFILGPMLQKEAETRLQRIPSVIIHLAAARLSAELRDDQVAEWRGELHFVLRGSKGMPLTRLWRSIRFSVGLLWAAPAIADGLEGTGRTVVRTARYVGAAAATGFGIWLAVDGFGVLHPPAALVGGWLSSPGPSPAEMAMMGIGYYCWAGAMLITGVALVTRRWGPVNATTGFFIGGAVASYLAGGSVWPLVLAAVLFCLLGATLTKQAKTRIARRAQCNAPTVGRMSAE
jgi:hypothetical protein